jgi:hypothetical protein
VLKINDARPRALREANRAFENRASVDRFWRYVAFIGLAFAALAYVFLVYTHG